MILNILTLLIRYRYFLLFPLAIVEGPIISIIAGFLCNTGDLNLWLVYPILIVGDNIGDSIYYALGRYGRSRKLEKLSVWLGLTPERLLKAKEYASANSNKMISLSKVIFGVGVAGLLLAGRAKIPYPRFYKVCLLTSFVQSAAYLTIGWFFGIFYQKISQYLDYASSIIIVITLGIIVFYFIKTKLNKL